MWKDRLFEILQKHGGKIFGIIFGLIVALCILFIGFFKTIFIGICIFVGYFVGKKIDSRESFSDFIDIILPPWNKRS